MNISVFGNKPVYQKNSELAYQRKDTVSFGAMKKSQFSDSDLLAVNRFKAPIEKFNTNEDLQNWCLDKLNKEYFNKKFYARKPDVTIQRQCILTNWIDYLKNQSNYNKALVLFLMQCITSDLKGNNDNLPPELNQGVLNETITEVQEKAKNNRNLQVDFNKIYKNNLKKDYLQEENKNQALFTGWVIIPSRINDSENFRKNVEKLKSLSSQRWCTKSQNAKPYLSQGDFHVYIDEGKPKLGVRFIKNSIYEIQGENNDNKIPIKYLNVAKEHTKNESMHSLLKLEFLEAEKIISRFEDKMGVSLENATTEDLLNAVNINYKRDNDGLLIIDSYYQPGKTLSWDDLGINENNFFKEIKEITGDADFSYSKISNLGKLKKIGGNAYFEECSLKNLNGLEEICGNANLRWSKINDTGNCKIGGEIINCRA